MKKVRGYIVLARGASYVFITPASNLEKRNLNCEIVNL